MLSPVWALNRLVMQQLAAGVNSFSSACRERAKQDFIYNVKTFCGQKTNYSQQEDHLYKMYTIRSGPTTCLTMLIHIHNLRKICQA